VTKQGDIGSQTGMLYDGVWFRVARPSETHDIKRKLAWKKAKQAADGQAQGEYTPVKKRATPESRAEKESPRLRRQQVLSGGFYSRTFPKIDLLVVGQPMAMTQDSLTTHARKRGGKKTHYWKKRIGRAHPRY